MNLLWEWWLQVWPNLAASALTFTGGLLWARRGFLKEMERRELAHVRRHEEMLHAVKEKTEGGGV